MCIERAAQLGSWKGLHKKGSKMIKFQIYLYKGIKSHPDGNGRQTSVGLKWYINYIKRKTITKNRDRSPTVKGWAAFKSEILKLTSHTYFNMQLICASLIFFFFQTVDGVHLCHTVIVLWISWRTAQNYTYIKIQREKENNQM